MTIEDLVARCKGSVTLTVNGPRDVYATVAEYIGPAEELEPEEIQRLAAAPSLYELAFYPDTPVGFYRVWGVSLAEVLTQAEACLVSDN